MAKDKKYQSEYYLKNKEAKKDYNRQSYLKNREKRLAEAKEKRRARTPEQVLLDKQRAAEYYKRNAEHFREKRRDLTKKLKLEVSEKDQEIAKLKKILDSYRDCKEE